MNLVNYIELFLIILCHHFRLAHITPIMWWQIIAGNQEYSIVAKSSSSSYEWMQFREMQMMHLESYLYIFFDIAILLPTKIAILWFDTSWWPLLLIACFKADDFLFLSSLVWEIFPLPDYFNWCYPNLYCTMSRKMVQNASKLHFHHEQHWQ